MTTETLTSKDDIEKILTDFIKSGCIISPCPKKLRVNYFDRDRKTCKSIRLESLRSLSEEFKKNLVVRRYMQFKNTKTQKTEEIDIDDVKYIATINNQPEQRIFGLNVSIQMYWNNKNEYEVFLNKILDGTKWPSSVFIIHIVESNMTGEILKRYPVEIHGGNGFDNNKSCLFGYVNDSLFK